MTIGDGDADVDGRDAIDDNDDDDNDDDDDDDGDEGTTVAMIMMVVMLKMLMKLGNDWSNGGVGINYLRGEWMRDRKWKLGT